MNDITIEKLIEKVSSYNPDEVANVMKAYKFAAMFHSGQKRQSGEDYITHPLNVAYILAGLHADGNTLCAALLHDTLEDTNTTKEEISEQFNKTVAMLVDGVTKINKLNFSSYTKQDLRCANTRKLIMGITEDVRIIIIKLADRLHNMRTLQFKSIIKQRENALETIEIFAPFANYLGEYRIKEELEDLSLKYLNPDEYKRYEEMRLNLEKECYPILQEMLYNIKIVLNNNNIPNEIKMRIKNIYGIYKKQSKGAKIKDIQDLLMLKIIVNSINECYLSLRFLHETYHPNNQIKDYICNPKINMYQSLHSTIIAPDGRLVKAQIRTPDMDKVASYGLATYWHIHNGQARDVMQENLKNKYQFFDSLLEIDSLFGDNQQFVDEVKREIFTDQIHVYTTDGNIISLPKGSTVIDFVYRTHSEVGKIIVNDEEVTKDYILQNDDRVKIITNKIAACPKEEWLECAHTGTARKRIKDALKKAENNRI